MIQISDKHNCCGCNACAQKCPKQCISMFEDEEGFLYPKVDLEKCIDCHLCEKLCPCLNKLESKEPFVCYAAKNNDERIRRESSSGGIFTAIAEKIIENSGVVFGACFDDCWQVVHSYVEKKEGLAAFRGSKYVQSKIGDSFRQVEDFLSKGCVVLFSGTPCQISGLNHFLNKEYDNLLTIEVVCHGVPSPKIWREYLKALKLPRIGSISYRDKSTGWRGYSFSVKDIEGNFIYKRRASDDKYMLAFFRNLILRPSCFNCPSKAGRSCADITLADYWGIEHIVPYMDDGQGTSFIGVNTEKGNAFIRGLNLHIEQTDYHKSVPYNSCIIKSTREPAAKQQFWTNYHKNGIDALLSLQKQNIFLRIIKRIFL